MSDIVVFRCAAQNILRGAKKEDRGELDTGKYGT